MIKTHTIVLSDDTIELMYNDILSSRQYLIRLTGWNNYYDIRISKDELQDLANNILKLIENNDR